MLTNKYGVDKKFAGQIKSLWKTLKVVDPDAASKVLKAAKLGGKIAPWLTVLLFAISVEQHGVKGAIAEELGVAETELDSLMEGNFKLNPELFGQSLETLTLPGNGRLGGEHVLRVGGFITVTRTRYEEYLGEAKIIGIYQTGVEGVYDILLDSDGAAKHGITLDIQNLHWGLPVPIPPEAKLYNTPQDIGIDSGDSLKDEIDRDMEEFLRNN